MKTASGPLTRLLDLRERMNQLFDELVQPVEHAGRQVVWAPVADVAETEDGYALHLELPGIDPAAVAVEVVERSVCIRGRRPYPADDPESVHRIERQYGAFSRTFELPEPVSPVQFRRIYENGVLIVVLTRIG